MRQFLIGAIAALALPASAIAGPVIMDTDDTGPLQPAVFMDTLIVNQAAANIGIYYLWEIQVKLTGFVDLTIDFTANSDATINSLQSGARIDADGPLMLNVEVFPIGVDIVVPIDLMDGDMIQRSGTGMDMATASLTPADGPQFAAFIGAGTVNFDITSVTDTISSVTGNVVTDPQGLSRAELKVTYIYHTDDKRIPEPMTLGLFGLGLAGAGYAASRRMRK